MKIYFMDDEQFAKLRKIHSDLHGGTDRERDYGHRLWLLCNAIEEQVEEVQEEEKKENPLYFPNIVKWSRESGLRFYMENAKVHLSMAGRLSVVSPHYGGGYYGGFDNFGNFKPTKDCTPAIIAQLRDIEDNGIEAAKRIGLLTGHCCICGRLLTDEYSIAGGIGPICAGKFGIAIGGNRPITELEDI